MIQIKARQADGSYAPIWTAFPKQEEVLIRDEFEVLFGGARGGAKTACGIAWLVMGNSVQGRETGTMADAGYYLHPNYRALVLRKNISDMGDWINKAKQLYGSDGTQGLGATYTNRPCEFRFKSGATIVIGHLDDEDAFEKYQGQEFTRILIEELTQIPSVDLYLKVMASCRCPFDDLRPQIFLTANPGGRGGHWVRERMVSCTPPGTTFTDPDTGLTRIFIAASVKDNPIFSSDRQYLGQLMALPPALRRAWLEGDWYAISGAMFEEFREKPLAGEPPEACHVIHSSEVRLEPWYHRWMGADWGYGHNACVHFACALPNGQIHIYNELSVNRTTPEEFGTAIARILWPEIQAGTQRNFQLFLPADAMAKKTSERTIGDQIATGIEQILGPNSVYIAPNADGSDPSVIFTNADLRSIASVSIQRANNQRVAGWMYMHSLLRWWPLLTEGAAFDPAYALRLYGEDRIKWHKYCQIFKDNTEILPRLQIHGDRCPKVVRAIPLAMAQDVDRGDPNDVVKSHWDGADEIDSLRYTCAAYQAIQVVEPWEQYFAKHMEKYADRPMSELSGQAKVMMARTAEAKYKALNAPMSTPIYWHRSSARAARVTQPKERL